MQEKIRGFEKISKEEWLKTGINEEYYDCQLPKRATANSAGYDVYSPISFVLEPNEEIKIPTGFKAYMQNNEFIMFVPRSGLGFKYYTRLANTVGIGDSDYYNNENNEGHYFVKIRNEGKQKLIINAGDAVAQAIFLSYNIVDGDDFIGEKRKGGFGSTDKK